MTVINIIDLLKSVFSLNQQREQGSKKVFSRTQMVFLLSGMYCTVAVIFLCLFAVEAFLADRTQYGLVLSGFLVITIVSYAYLWLSRKYHLGGYLVALIMAALCLYLFHTGGTDNTGALWYFLYPALVIFLLDTYVGLIAAIVLLLVSYLIIQFEVLGFDSGRYTATFLQRHAAVYAAITVISCLFAHFRTVAEKNLELINAKLNIISTTDALTGLFNRRKMEELLDRELSRFGRSHKPFSVLMLDIDYFKKINDTYGHHNGDLVLETFASICARTIRKVDSVCRWGGEEFLVLLPETQLKDAVVIAERLRREITSTDYNLDGTTLKVSASLGLAQYRKEITVDDCIRVADQCLYQAKENGRNCLVTEQDITQLDS